MKQQALSVTILGLLLTACNGSNSNPTTANTATGQFKDSNVAGLAYKSGSQSGTTNAKGEFTYEVGKPVTFSIGGLEFGSATGQAIVTPADLVDENDKNNSKATNIARVLQMLDEDGDPDNGISIVEASIKNAENWNKYDLHKTEADFEEDLKLIQADATASGNTHKIPSLEDTKAHLSKNMRCAYSGAYKGSYSGNDQGTFGLMVKAKDTSFYGKAFSNNPNASGYIELMSNAISADKIDKNVNFTASSKDNAFALNGSINLSGSIKGSWKDSESSDNGNFSGKRIDTNQGAKSIYRHTGKYASNSKTTNGSDFGLLTFDIDEKGNIAGLAYSVKSDTILKGNGTYNNGELTITLDNGTKVTGKHPKLSTTKVDTLTFDGTWTDTKQQTGWFYSEGCKLN